MWLNGVGFYTVNELKPAIMLELTPTETKRMAQ